MNSFKKFLANQEETEIDELIVSFNNVPSKPAPSFLFENAHLIEEGKKKEWGNGYEYRLDRRPDTIGGDQLHIYGRRGKAWAYRHTGQKSEPGKYTSPPTSIVKDIVSDIFKIDRNNIEEAIVRKEEDGKLFIDVTFI